MNFLNPPEYDKNVNRVPLTKDHKRPNFLMLFQDTTLHPLLTSLHELRRYIWMY